MYTKSAAIYDAIYRAARKDYAAEALKLIGFIGEHKRSSGRQLLDVACGTGNHIAWLQELFDIEGLDNSPEMLAEARKKHPGMVFHEANMVDFHLDRSFDVITCLFSAIGYVKTLPRLTQTICTFARHLQPDGIAIVEPWFGPGVLDGGSIHALFVDEPGLKIARMNINRVEGRLSYLDFEYLVGTPEGIERFSETDALGIFTDAEYQQAFRDAGLRVIHDDAGLSGRGLYIGIREQAAS